MRTVQLISLNLDFLYNSTIGRVLTWLQETLGEAMDVLSESVGSVLRTALNFVITDFWRGILDLIFARVYATYAAILLLLECIENGFRVMCGLDPVTVRGQGQMSLLNAVYSQENVRNMLGVMLAIGMALCFLFAILATVRSTFELGGERNQPVTHVLRQTAKAFLVYITIPIVSVAALSLSGAILKGINLAMTGTDQKTSMARIIFCISTLDAIDPFYAGAGSERYNSSYEGAVAADFGVMDKYRKPYSEVKPNETVPPYINILEVRKTFALRKIDYVIGLAGSIYFTVIMCMVLFVFISRIFDVVVLLIVEPIFVAPMPLDDGAAFKKWTGVFLGKLFGGYGSIVAMQLYIIIVEQVFSNSISFSARDSLGARVQDYLVSLIFAAGAGYAVQHIGPLITGLINEAAARSEQESAAAGLMVGSYIAGKEMKAVKSAVSSTAGTIGKTIGKALGFGGTKAFQGVSSLFGGRGRGAAGEGKEESGNKFSGERPAGGARTESSSAASSGGGGSSSKSFSGGSGGSGGSGHTAASLNMTPEERQKGLENLFGKGFEQHMRQPSGTGNKGGGSTGGSSGTGGSRLNDSDLNGFGNTGSGGSSNPGGGTGGGSNPGGDPLTAEQRRKGFESLFGVNYDQYMGGGSNGSGGGNPGGGGNFSSGFNDTGSGGNNSGGGNFGGFNQNDLNGFNDKGSGGNGGSGTKNEPKKQ